MTRVEESHSGELKKPGERVVHQADVYALLVASQPGLHKEPVPGRKGAVREEETNSERQRDSGSAGKEYKRNISDKANR